MWDQVEGRFAESLKAMEWALSDIIAVESGDDQGSTSTLELEESEEPSVRSHPETSVLHYVESNI